jgi:hypothetical protein
MRIYSVVIVVCALALVMCGCIKVTAPVDNSDKTAAPDKSTDTAPPATTPPADIPKECTEAIGYQVLVDAMPSDVNGYVADEPQGQMLSFTDPQTQKVIKYSMASETLTKDDKNIDVSLTDTCYVSFLSAAWLGFYEMEGTDGYLKQATISGNPGWHEYHKSSESYTYNLFVKDRVMVGVQGSNGVPDADVEAVAKAIDYAKIEGGIK